MVVGTVGMVVGVPGNGTAGALASARGYLPVTTGDDSHLSRVPMTFMMLPGSTFRGWLVYSALFSSGSWPSVV